MNLRETYRVESAVLALSLLLFYCLIFASLDSAYGVGDHGFYLAHILHPFDIDYTLTHFGLAWTFFFGDHGFVWNRAINVIMLSSVSLLLAVAAKKAFGLQANPALYLLFLAAFLTYFARFIVDPSYNSVSLSLVALGIASILLMYHAERSESAAYWVWALLLGGVLFFLVVAKASNALSLSFLFFIYLLYLTVRLRSLGRPLVLGIVSILGFLLVAAAFQLRTGSLLHVYSSFSAGLEAYASGEAHSGSMLIFGTLGRLGSYIKISLYAVYDYAWLVLSPVLLAACLVVLQGTAYGRERRGLAWVIALTAFAIPVVVCAFLLQSPSERLVRNVMLTAFNVSALFVLIRVLIGQEPAGFRLGALFVLLIPFVSIFGTVNSYVSQVLFMGAGLSLAPAYIMATSVAEPLRKSLTRVVLALAVALSLTSSYHMTQFPYGVGGKLSNAGVQVEIGDYDTIGTNAFFAGFLTELHRHRYSGAAEDKPVVFDFTGLFPVITEALNGLPPGAALFSDHFQPGFSKAVLSGMADEQIAGGWLLVRSTDIGAGDKESTHLNNFYERLGAMNIRFNDHFEAVSEFKAAHHFSLDNTFLVTLFKPKSP